MGYLNNAIGYPKDILQSRAVVKKNNYTVLDVDGLVKNVIPGYVNCTTTILGSPFLGATFADYLVFAHVGGKNEKIAGDGIESFLYVMEGEITVKNDDVEQVLTKGGYIFSPADKPLSFENHTNQDTKMYLYKRRYQAIEGYEAKTYVNNVENLEWVKYEGMEGTLIKDLLPAAQDLGFDMNMHILKFAPGHSHGYVETHYQQHGMITLTGQGMYNLDNEWMPIKTGDYIFMDAYTQQACYGVGQEDFSYLYSKDTNRDVVL